MRIFLIIMLLATAAAWALEAPTAFQSPVKTVEAFGVGLPPTAVDRYLDQTRLVHEHRGLRGQNPRLKTESLHHSPLKTGEWFPVELDGAAFYDEPFSDDGQWVHVASLRSLDAFALRVLADLSGLRPGDEAWALDPVTGHSFGPFSQDDHYPGGFWLPTIQGDTAVILVRSVAHNAPSLKVVGASHQFFEESELKQLWCNLTLDDVDDPELYALASGVGRIATSVAGEGSWVCSGALVNAPGTAEFEPYFLTANHCVSTTTQALGSEVVWDYRSASDSPISLPRSNGAALLATNDDLDITLIELDNVPDGPHGRAYAGWSTVAPQTGNALSGLHHPGGSYMRASFGAVLNPNVSSFVYVNQINVGWSEGVTEGGSSGSPLFNSDNLVIGVLSNGSVHVCGGTPQQNFDNYASFRHFFPQVEQYLNVGPPPPAIVRQSVSRWVEGTPGTDLILFVEVQDLPESAVYEWRKDGAPLVDGGRINGSASAELVIDAPLEPGDSGTYLCVISYDEVNKAQLNSAPIHILVVPEGSLPVSATGVLPLLLAGAGALALTGVAVRRRLSARNKPL